MYLKDLTQETLNNIINSSDNNSTVYNNKY